MRSTGVAKGAQEQSTSVAAKASEAMSNLSNRWRISAKGRRVKAARRETAIKEMMDKMERKAVRAEIEAEPQAQESQPLGDGDGKPAECGADVEGE